MKRHTLGNLRLVSAAGLAIVLLATPGGANASTRYYGVAAWYNATTNVGSAVPDMYVASGFVADYNASGFIAQVLWQGTNNSTGLNYWAEEGYTYGWKGQNILTWYWAENRPNGLGYDEVEITDQTPTVGQYDDVEIYWVYPNWDVALNGVLEGVSDANPCCGEALETGVESTSSQSALSGALSHGMAYRPYGSSWVSGWGSATGLYQDYPAYAQWQLQYVNLIDGM